MVRELLGDGDFVEVFVDTPIEDCMKRDPKGLYAKALKGEIENFTGVTSPYEAPEAAEIVLQTRELSAVEAADRVIEELKSRGVI
jgi:adenylylsulfate kinase-like enzyme